LHYCVNAHKQTNK